MKPSDQNDVRVPSLEITTFVLEIVQCSDHRALPKAEYMERLIAYPLNGKMCEAVLRFDPDLPL